MSESVEIQVIDASGNPVRKANVSSAFAVAKDEGASLLHQVVRWQRAKRRVGSHVVKTRSEVAGGGAKPWKQKGTGRARAGSNSSPIWVGGGVAHGPKCHGHDFRMNRKERRFALAKAVSVRRSEDRLIVVDSLGFNEIKTSAAVDVLSALGVDRRKKVLVVIPDNDEIIEKSFRNITGITVISAHGLNVYDVLLHGYLVLVGDAVNKVDERIAQ